jgi:hypothetical protein
MTVPERDITGRLPVIIRIRLGDASINPSHSWVAMPRRSNGTAGAISLLDYEPLTCKLRRTD